MFKIEDFSFSPSSIDDFYAPPKKKDSSYKIKVASLNELNGFVRIASDTLIHVAQKDFWRLAQDENGEYVIERMADDQEGPIKG